MLSKDNFKGGRLDEAIAAAKDEVRAQPGDPGRRAFLAKLLCFAGDLERADQHFDAAVQLDPKLALGISTLRQLIRSEKARSEVFTAGRLPEFLEPPTEELRLRLQALISIRAEKPGEGMALVDRAEELRPRISGSLNGKPFDDLRDLDDLTASAFEVLTTNGKYYWVPMDRIEVMEFQAPEETSDLLWRRVHMVVRGGPDGEVYVPALYHGSHQSAEARFRLGRETDWRGGSGAPTRGVGQKIYLAGEDDIPILEMKLIEIRQAGSAA